MILPSRRQYFRWFLILIGIVAFVGWLALSPIGKPADQVRTLYLSPRYGKAKLEYIRSKSNRRGLPHLPRFVELQSNGAKFRAYVLDLSGVAKWDRPTALEEARKGIAPTQAPLRHEAVDVTEAYFPLFSFPWGRHDDMVVIVVSEEEAEVSVRVSYGGDR